jgi:hypothetical protein
MGSLDLLLHAHWDHEPWNFRCGDKLEIANRQSKFVWFMGSGLFLFELPSGDEPFSEVLLILSRLQRFSTPNSALFT